MSCARPRCPQPLPHRSSSFHHLPRCHPPVSRDHTASRETACSSMRHEEQPSLIVPGGSGTSCSGLADQADKSREVLDLIVIWPQRSDTSLADWRSSTVEGDGTGGFEPGRLAIPSEVALELTNRLRLLLASREVRLAHATKPATRALSRA